MKKIIAFSVLLTTVSSYAWDAPTSDHSWRSGWMQGTPVAQVTNGIGNDIFVTCINDEDEDGSSVTIRLAGRPVGDYVFIAFNNGKFKKYPFYDGSLVANSRATDGWFLSLIDNIKKHNLIHVRAEDGRQVSFTLNGSSKAIGYCKGFW